MCWGFLPTAITAGPRGFGRCSVDLAGVRPGRRPNLHQDKVAISLKDTNDAELQRNFFHVGDKILIGDLTQLPRLPAGASFPADAWRRQADDPFSRSRVAPMITLRNITKSYQMGTQVVHALRGVDLTVDAGEFVAIMGPSGSGKSTLMNIIGCLDPPTSGAYTLDGIDVSADERRRPGAGAQPADRLRLPAVQPAAAHVGAQTGGAAADVCRRTDERERWTGRGGAAGVGLGDRMDHRPDELSGGQQQRVAIARALVTEPNIILADEPTGALDTQTGEEILGMFERLNEQGITIIMVTHDPEVAERARRTIWIRDGLIQRSERWEMTSCTSERSKT